MTDAARCIRLVDLEPLLLRTLPELAVDMEEYRSRKAGDPEFSQGFFGYSFIPTLQAALDRGVHDFCRRAFLVVEELVVHGDAGIRALLDDEFFAYGPHCEGWMGKAVSHMGPETLRIAQVSAQK